MKKDKQEGMIHEKQKRGSVLAVLFTALVVSVLLFFAMVIAERSLLEKNREVVTVVMTKENIEGGEIPQGSYIPKSQLSDYFVVCEIDAELVPNGCYHKLDELGDVYTNRQIGSNMIVVKDWFCQNADNQVVISNPVQVSFGVDDLSSAVAGTLRKGDYISIGTIYKNENNEFDIMPIISCVMVDEAYNSDGVIASSLNGNDATLFTVTLPQDCVDPFFASCANGTLVVGKVIE